MGQAEAIHITSFSIPDTGNDTRFSPYIIDSRATVSDLWAMRALAFADLQRHYDAEDEAEARGAPLAERRRLEEETGIPYDRVWNVDWNIVQTTPRNFTEHAIQAQVLEMRICPDDGTIPEDFLRAYCTTIRRMALA